MRPVPKPTKRDRELAKAIERADRALKFVSLRATVMERGRLFCEACKDKKSGQVHHIFYGNGKRREHEDRINLVAICTPCHDLVHKNDPATLERLMHWAEVYGYMGSRQELERRWAKAVRRRR